MEIKRLNTLKYMLFTINTSQRELSMMAGIPEGRFSHLITGRLPIRDNERAKLCELLKMKDEDLFKELYDKTL